MNEAFTLTLAQAAPVAELEAWFESAPAGAQARYASGCDLPREAEGVKLVRLWQERGLAHLARHRDPINRGCWIFLVEKSAAGSSERAAGPQARPPARSDTAEIQAAINRRLLRMALRHLRICAERGAPCPSDSELRDELKLPRSNAGRSKAGHLIQRLAREGAIAVESYGRNARRVVTILAPGRACGMVTASDFGMPGTSITEGGMR